MKFRDWLMRFVGWAVNRPRQVLLIWLALGAGSAMLASLRLGVTTDTGTLFSASLPWKQQDADFNAAFPQFSHLIVAVVDGRTPEQVRETSAALALAANGDSAHFTAANDPEASPYFNKNGLLFVDTKTLSPLLDQTVDAQPFIGQLAADPSARGLFSALSLIGVGVLQGQADNLGAYQSSLAGFHQALQAEVSGQGQPLSWQKLLSGAASDLGGKYRFVLVHPRLNYGALEPGGEATDALRAIASGLPDVKSGAVRVRITGDVPLSDEEFASVAQGMLWGLAGSFVLVVLWLRLAVKSLRLIVPIVITLVMGLLVTIGFAAGAVGTLNLVSVAFAILFVGIAVDFAIQFCVRFREAKHEGLGDGPALMATAQRSGVQILVAAAATSAGFLAFVPTDFSGVAQLGLIAGVGMLIAFAATVTFLPALLMMFHPPGEGAEIGFSWARTWDKRIGAARGPLLGIFAGLALAGLMGMPRIAFDSDPLHTKNAHTEAMQTLADIMQDAVTNPYTINVLTPDLASAEALAGKLRGLPGVDEVLTEASYVPADQKAKLALLEDTESVMAPTLSPGSTAVPVTAEDLRIAIKSAADQLTKAAVKLPAGSNLRLIAEDLTQLEGASDERLMAMNDDLTRFLPDELAQLREGLAAGPVSLNDLPPEIARDWVAPDGRARVEVVPAAGARAGEGLRQFVAAVRKVAPNAGGAAVTIVASADTIIASFRQAAISAVLAIALILLVVLRRVKDTLLVLAPLLLSSVLTALAMLLLGRGLNFANIIALPLLLGVGVSFNIYFIMNWRAGLTSPLGSPTARAVMFSALTTGTAFGALALSGHPGTSSMGVLLLLSLAATLISTLCFVPALLAAVGKPGK
jgi:hopanoid biosynthesis associated RND transporter like protein HpnN